MLERYVGLFLCKYASSISLTSFLIVFSGFKDNIDDFIKQYNIKNILSAHKVSDNSTFDKFIIKTILSKKELQKLVNDLTISDFYQVISKSKYWAGNQLNILVKRKEK